MLLVIYVVMLSYILLSFISLEHSKTVLGSNR